jgi:ubiquitin C-terminal hydrolase
MAPYTADGVRRAEQSEQEKKHASVEGESSMDTPETPTSNRKVSFSSMFSKGDVDFSQPYELVGVVVHSGQASAGHYYSFIKVISIGVESSIRALF